MDDHMYDMILEYAMRDLIPRFKSEYAESGLMSKCASYKEVKALCAALNAVAPYAGYDKITPASFLD